MALPTLQTGLNVKRRVLQFSGIDAGAVGVSPEANAQLRTFFETLGQFKGNPNLVVVPFDELSSTETVIADAAGTLYALYLRKDTATLTFSKITDNATTSSDTASEFVIATARIGDQVLTWPSGWAFANGITMQGNTTADGGTGSSSNGAKGFAIIGAA